MILALILNFLFYNSDFVSLLSLVWNREHPVSWFKMSFEVWKLVSSQAEKSKTIYFWAGVSSKNIQRWWTWICCVNYTRQAWTTQSRKKKAQVSAIRNKKEIQSFTFVIFLCLFFCSVCLQRERKKCAQFKAKQNLNFETQRSAAGCAFGSNKGH